MRILRAMLWFRALFAWETCRNTGVWLYQENKLTNARRIIRIASSGYQPIDEKWLNAKTLRKYRITTPASVENNNAAT
jgi:hypothetical protein